MTAGTTSRVPTQQRGRSALQRLVARRRRAVRGRHAGRNAPLVTRAADLPGGLLELFGEDAVDELVSRRGLRAPFLRVARNGADPRRPRVHPGRRRRGVGRRPGERRQAAAPLRRRARRSCCRGCTARGARSSTSASSSPRSSGTRSRPTPTSRRARAPASATTTTCTTSSCSRWAARSTGACGRPCTPLPLRDEPWTDHRAAVEEASTTRAGPRVHAAPGRRALPPARLGALRDRARRRQHPPHARRPRVDPAPPRRRARRLGPRGGQPRRAGAGLARRVTRRASATAPSHRRRARARGPAARPARRRARRRRRRPRARGCAPPSARRPSARWPSWPPPSR